MSSTDYGHILEVALRELSVLSRERDELDARLVSLRQFIYATVNMLPDAKRSAYQAELAMLASEMGSLTDSVREALKLATQRDSYFTVAEVRDHLTKAGFDFTKYTSNPLASVNTVLRRFKPDEVETTMRDGVTAYRWVRRFPRIDAEQLPRRRIQLED
jgi:hypothetical protein